MPVYVDNMKLRAKIWRWAGEWSHLWADTTAELEDFAEEHLQLSAESVIDRGFTTERMLINKTRRDKALAAGAWPILFGWTQMASLTRDKRLRGYTEKDMT